MILVDTSIWIDHLRDGDPVLKRLLEQTRIASHPLVIAEIALGSLRQRKIILGLLDGLPSASEASIHDIRSIVETYGLFSRGIGFVDVALVASCLRESGMRLWTRDRRLRTVATELDISANLPAEE